MHQYILMTDTKHLLVYHKNAFMVGASERVTEKLKFTLKKMLVRKLYTDKSVAIYVNPKYITLFYIHFGNGLLQEDVITKL